MSKKIVLTVDPEQFAELLAALEEAGETIREEAERRAGALDRVVEYFEAQIEGSLVEDDEEEDEEERPS